MQTIQIYGASWCPDARRARRFFDENKVDYVWKDVDTSADAHDFVKKTNHGTIIIPIILFPDGSIMIEPSNYDLARKLEQIMPAENNDST